MANTLFLILSIVLVFLFGMVNTRLGNLDLLASLNDIDSGLQCNILEIRVSLCKYQQNKSINVLHKLIGIGGGVRRNNSND